MPLRRYQASSHIDFLHRKRSIRSVKRDQLQWQRALYCAQVYADAENYTFANSAARNAFINAETKATYTQTAACERLQKECEPYETVHEFLRNAAAWIGSHVCIQLWTSISQTPTFRYGNLCASVCLNLVLSVEGENKDDDVLYVLTSPKAFNNKRQQCSSCGLMYQHNHTCQQEILKHKGLTYRCELCRKPFVQEDSRDAHEEQCRKEICELCHCVFCADDERESEEHICGEFYCRSCRLIVSPDHLCCLQKLEILTLKEQKEILREEAESQQIEYERNSAVVDPIQRHKIIVFDVETEASSALHKPILICCKRSTDMAEFTFGGEQNLKNFCEWLFCADHANFVVIAHNFSGFDGAFIMKFLENSFINPDVMVRGSKIMSLTVKEWNIRCIDFLLFAPMKLSKLPKALEVRGVAKTFFPHKFSSPANLSYVGPIVDAQFYSPDEMTTTDRNDFLQWYANAVNTQIIFNFWDTLVEYCRNDVDILMQSVLKYREIFMRLSDGVDPFDYTTMPQACFVTYRARHLPEDTFGILPLNGYQSHLMQSKLGRLWMAYETRHDGEHVRTKFDNGEVRVVNFRVDGSTSKRFLEFYGVGIIFFSTTCVITVCPK